MLTISHLIVGIICLFIGVVCGLFLKRETFRDELRKHYRQIHYAECGEHLNDVHFWFTGRSPQLLNALFFISLWLKKYGHVPASKLRDAVDKLGDERYCDLKEEQYQEFL